MGLDLDNIAFDPKKAAPRLYELFEACGIDETKQTALSVEQHSYFLTRIASIFGASSWKEIDHLADYNMVRNKIHKMESAINGIYEDSLAYSPKERMPKVGAVTWSVTWYPTKNKDDEPMEI
jgi:hypothetical protein